MNRFFDITSALSKIDVRAASAFDKADELMIKAAVSASAGGFEAVNGLIHDRLREWLADASRDLLACRRETLGHMLRDALRCRRETLGDTHPDTLAPMNNLANLLSDQGKLDEAEPLFRDVLRCRRETLGDTHPHTLVSKSNLAGLLIDQGKLDEAEPLLLEALRGRREILGYRHPDTLTTNEARP